jgi:hypothetical protein
MRRPIHKDAPPAMRIRLDASGKLEKSPVRPPPMTPQLVAAPLGDPDGYSVNTSQPPYRPSAVPPAWNR